VRHRLGLATRTQISVCKSPFPSAGTAVSLFRAKMVQQRPLLMSEQMSERRQYVVRSCDKWPRERWRCVHLLKPVSGKGSGRCPYRLTLLSSVTRTPHTDKMTAARPGLELDFGLNVVRSESVTQFDWTMCCIN